MQALGAIGLVTGSEEFLAERFVQQVRESVRKADPDAEFSETEAAGLSIEALADLAAPSLFSANRCVVVRHLQQLPDESVEGLVSYAQAPAAEVALVLVHDGGTKHKGLLDKIRAAEAGYELKAEAVPVRKLPDFVAAEVKAAGGRIDREAADLLIQAIGPDLRALAAAAAQLVADSAGEALSPDLVGRYFSGRSEVKAFGVADLALKGRTAEALAELRWTLESGTAPVLVTGAMASKIRELIRYRGGTLTGPEWKLRTIRDQARGWSDAGLARSMAAVAEADAGVKGREHDPAFALETLVLAMGRYRAR